ncbi:MAG TPA: cell division protein ZipA C-terminal FtsZ-binding domain-containing protein [Burkholderiales bacterium]
MSDLQIGLAMLGVLVVAAVVTFNWWQERKYRQRGEVSFSGRHDDVLLGVAETASAAAQAVPESDASDETRIEPSMEPRLEPRMESAPGTAASEPDSAPDAQLDYIAEMRAGEFISVATLLKMQQRLPGLSRRIAFGGFNHQSQSWEALRRDDARYTSVCAALQLVDRSGPVNDEQLRAFADEARNTASEMAASAVLPELAPALARAAELDNFCAEVDVMVGINVIANSGQVFHGTKIRALAEAAGLHLQPAGVFHCQDEQGVTLFSLENQASEPFLIDRIRNMTTPGVTFLLDVPRTANGLRIFDKMVAMSRNFADSLDGTLADDNRAMLNDDGLDRIRVQLRAIYATMEQRGLQAGSALAQRLFS